jgi:hypothetical protein
MLRQVLPGESDHNPAYFQADGPRRVADAFATYCEIQDWTGYALPIRAV